MSNFKIKKRSEFRQDPVSKEWVVIAAGRAFRPHQIKSQKRSGRIAKTNCPFEDPQSTGHQKPVLMIDLDGKELRYDTGAHDWFLQIIPNKFPILKGTGCGIERRRGLFVSQIGAGFHEVVVFRDHDRDPSQFSSRELSTMLFGYQRRYRMLAGKDCAEYILIFHNHGPAAGASIYHPHSQIVAMPVIPPDVGRSITGSSQFYKKNRSCIHCAMILEEKREKKRIVYENEEMIAFCPYASRVSFETRIFPKKHEYAFEHIESKERDFLADAMAIVLQKIRKVLKSPSYNFFIHTAPTRPEYFAHYHWHIEILPRTSIWAGVELGTGIEVVAVPPEVAAHHLRLA